MMYAMMLRMHSETTNIIDMSAAARVQRRRAEQRALSAEQEQHVIAKLVSEGWIISFDKHGNWSAIKGSN